jgi:RimJ/RimL family protein N-acetyltransferase
MSRIAPHSYVSKSGLNFEIRSAEKDDASAILALMQKVLREGRFTLSLPEEIATSVEQEIQWIEQMNLRDRKVAIIAVLGSGPDSKVVGMLDFNNGMRKRNSHQGEFGMSVALEHREDGIGNALLTELLKWATYEIGLEKVVLRVAASNARAIALYEKTGFVREGLERKSVKFEFGDYEDTIVMAKFVK